MSWLRTALTSAGTAALLLRLGKIHQDPTLLVAGVGLAAIAIAAYGAARTRVRRVADAIADGKSPATPALLRAVAVAVVAVAVAVIIAIVS